MDSHLVAVEVGVKCATCKGVKFDCSTFYENGLKCLDTKSVERRSTVEKDGVIFDDFFKDIPNLMFACVNKSLCALDVVAEILFHKFLHNEGLEEFKCHFLRKTALIKFEFRTDDDN